MFAHDTLSDEQVAEVLHSDLILVLGRTQRLPPHVDCFQIVVDFLVWELQLQAFLGSSELVLDERPDHFLD